MNEQYYIYILASGKNSTLYIGITSDLAKRIWEHKNNKVKGFSSKYKIHTLVYYEIFDHPEEAIAREKQLKWWKRKWKIDLIEIKNKEWRDLYQELL